MKNLFISIMILALLTGCGSFDYNQESVKKLNSGETVTTNTTIKYNRFWKSEMNGLAIQATGLNGTVEHQSSDVNLKNLMKILQAAQKAGAL